MALFRALAVLPLAAYAFDGIPADNQMVEKPGLVRYPITVVDGAPAKDRVFRRQNEVGLVPQKSGFFYSIEVKLGTPSQPVSVNFDTGSDELWVNPSCSKSADAKFCQGFGRFNGSQTFVDVKRNSTINYGTGFANLEYGYDYVQIGSSKLSQQLLGVATDSEFAVTGILGAGPNLDGWKSHYPTVIDNLATQGFIQSRAFSLDIRSLESKRGSVIFGGIDTKKYTGHLEKLPIVPAADAPDGNTRYWVYLDGISISAPNGTVVNVFDKPKGQVVLLDSGYTVSALPSVHFDKIVAAFPQAKPPASGSNLYQIPCSVGNAKGHLAFKFGKTTIKVSYNDFIWHQSGGVCVLGVTRDDAFPVLGDTFLRAAYVVYDWDNRNLHVASNQDCGSHLVAIGKGPDAVPSIVGECGAASTPYGRPVATPASNSTSGGINGTASNMAAEITSRPIATSSSGGSNAFGMQTAASDSAREPTMSQANSEMADNSGSSYSDVPKDSHPDLSIPSGGSSGSPAFGNMSTLTSTFTSTSTYPVASCHSSVTDCAVGSVTTEIVTGTTTWCPSQSATAAIMTTVTSIVVTKTTVTITKHSWSDITATWTIPRTHTCTQGEHGCVPGQKITTTHIVTVKPMTTGPSPTPVPGCTDCRMPPPVAVTSVPTSPAQPPPQVYQNPQPQVVNATVPCPSCGIVGTGSPMVTAGAAAWKAPWGVLVAAIVLAATV